jgi:hypothetical protein
MASKSLGFDNFENPKVNLGIGETDYIYDIIQMCFEMTVKSQKPHRRNRMAVFPGQNVQALYITLSTKLTNLGSRDPEHCLKRWFPLI